MQKDVVYQARDVPPEKRRAAEVLLGETLGEDEVILVRASRGRILKQAPAGDARSEAFGKLFERIDRTAKRAEDAPESEIDSAIDEAAEHVRHRRG